MPQFPQYQNATLVEFATFANQAASFTAASGGVYDVTTGASTITVTLPPVAQGGPVVLTKIDSGTGAIKAVTSDSSQICGVAGATGITQAATQFTNWRLVSDGSNWHLA